jgi:hypothetical protein
MMKQKKMVILLHTIKIKVHLPVKFGQMMQLSQISLKMRRETFGNLNLQKCKTKLHLMDFG